MKSLHLVIALAFFALNSFAQVVPELPRLTPPLQLLENDTYYILTTPSMPIFLGCEHIADINERHRCSDRKMTEFMNQNLKYPNLARESGFEGKVFVRFVVEIDGSMSNIVVLKDMTAGGGLKEAALELMELMQKGEKKWTPASTEGQPERTRIVVPIKFKLP
jgi:protein TonB